MMMYIYIQVFRITSYNVCYTKLLRYSGIELLEEVEGVIILDPITGDSDYYDVEDVPTWVDHVYSADLIVEQLDDWGQYKDGFLNSIFGHVITSYSIHYTKLYDNAILIKSFFPRIGI